MSSSYAKTLQNFGGATTLAQAPPRVPPPLEGLGRKRVWCLVRRNWHCYHVRVYPGGGDYDKQDHSGRIELRLILVDAWYRSYA